LRIADSIRAILVSFGTQKSQAISVKNVLALKWERLDRQNLAVSDCLRQLGAEIASGSLVWN